MDFFLRASDLTVWLSHWSASFFRRTCARCAGGPNHPMWVGGSGDAPECSTARNLPLLPSPPFLVFNVYLRMIVRNFLRSNASLGQLSLSVCCCCFVVALVKVSASCATAPQCRLAQNVGEGMECVDTRKPSHT